MKEYVAIKNILNKKNYNQIKKKKRKEEKSGSKKKNQLLKFKKSAKSTKTWQRSLSRRGETRRREGKKAISGK